jgi:hypothetical protein
LYIPWIAPKYFWERKDGRIDSGWGTHSKKRRNPITLKWEENLKEAYSGRD